jgi:putative transposase
VATDVADRVKRWRGGDMRLRWIAAGLVAAEKRFRGVRGHKLMPKLLAALGCGGIAGGSKAA